MRRGDGGHEEAQAAAGAQRGQGVVGRVLGGLAAREHEAEGLDAAERAAEGGWQEHLHRCYQAACLRGSRYCATAGVIRRSDCGLDPRGRGKHGEHGVGTSMQCAIYREGAAEATQVCAPGCHSLVSTAQHSAQQA